MNVFLLPMVLSSCALTPKSTFCKSGRWVICLGFSGGLLCGVCYVWGIVDGCFGGV